METLFYALMTIVWASEAKKDLVRSVQKMTFTDHDAIVELARQILENKEIIDDLIEQAAEAGRSGNSKEETKLMQKALNIVKLNKILAKDMVKFT